VNAVHGIVAENFARTGGMPIVQQVDRDLIVAMKAKEELRLSVLRMMKAAFKLKQV
jgi:hypothetical protein